MTFRSFALFCALFLLSVGVANAQDYLYATGSPVYSTSIPIDHGVVNVNNGEIHLEIPLVVKPQRGTLALSEKLIYDSRIWKIVQSNSLQWQPTNIPNSIGGWSFSSGLDSGSITFGGGGGSDPNSPACAGATIPSSQDYQQYYDWVWKDATGTSHAFPDAVTTQWLPPQNVNCTGGSPPDTPNSAATASDGSGYVLQLTNFTTPTIIGPDGTTYHPSLIANNPPPQSQNIVDRYGNFWSPDTNGNLVDTSGVSPVVVSTNGNQTFYDVMAVGGGRQRYTVTTMIVIFNTGFNESAVSERAGSFNAIQSIQLPDGSQYSFTYDSGSTGVHYGEMTSMTLPTGGVINFDYINFKDSFNNQNEWIHTIKKDGGTITFQPAVISQCSSSVGCQEKVTVSRPDNNGPNTNDTVYTFTLDKAGQIAGSSWVQSIDSYQGLAGGTRLRTTSTTFTYNTSSVVRLINGISVPIGTFQTPATLTNVVTLDTGQASQTVSTLRSAPGPSEVKVWDFGSSFTGNPTTDTLYSYAGFNLLQSVTVKDGAGNQISNITYGFDETPVAPTSGLPNHTAISSAGVSQTSSHEWINSGGTYDTSFTYDDAGTLVTKAEPNGKMVFGHDASDTYVTSTTYQTVSGATVLQTSTGFDASTGLLTSSTDGNGTQTTYKNFDVLNRAQEIDVENGALVGKSTLSYTPTQSSQITYQDASTSSDTETQFDPYGRVSRIAMSNGQTSNPWYQNDTCYNVNGDVVFQSYRYQANGFASPKVCQSSGDSFAYDALGRTKSITHSDQTSTQFTYRGNATQTTDESGASRIVQIDGFGRQTAICELSSSSTMPSSGSPVGCGTDLPGTGFVTSFSQDLQNHKMTVTQGAQTRVFQTDSLGRSTLVQEPERGQTTYSYAYNATGLVITRQRPQANQTNPNVLTGTTYQYDSLGRLINKSYSDGEGPALFIYDIPTAGFVTVPPNDTLKVTATLNNTKGRLAIACKENPAQNFCIAMDALSYDANGNVITKWSSAPNYALSASPVRSQSFTYDWEGNLLSSSDGAGITTSYHYSVASEVTSIASSRNDATHPGNLITAIQNGPNGPLSWQYGNGLSHASQYDSLGRQVGWYDCAGSSQINCSGGTIKNGYFQTVQGSRVTSACTGPCTNYGYDDFNRLSSRTQTSGTPNNYTYAYDRYGNRWQQNALSGGFSPSLSFDVSTNHVNTAGYTYDATGNLMSDGINSYSYDAEGNLTQEVSPSSTAKFTYDALNRQVRTDFITFGVATEILFTPTGEFSSLWYATSTNNSLISAKASWAGTPIESYVVDKNMAYFQFRDGVGSDALVSDAQGNVVSQRSYLPFGDGFTSISGSRDNTFDGFAGLWDGVASSTNHAQFREYNNTQGRWISPDPSDGSYDFSDPQSFNRYAYVLNKPLTLTDPTGLDGGGGGGVLCYAAVAQGGANVGNDVACAVTAVFDWLFFKSLFGGPSFHGSLQPRPTNGQVWNDTYTVPYTGLSNGITGALGFPSNGCEFGACGGLPDGFQAGAAAPVFAAPICAIAEPCGAIVLGTAIAITGIEAGVAGYKIYQRGRTNVSDTGITSEAQQLIAQGLAKTMCEALAILQRQTRDSARLQKIKATQKAFGCRRSSAQS